MSLKGDKYETAEEVRFRLEGTVVLYEGRPVYINRVGTAEGDDRKEISRVYFFELPMLRDVGRKPRFGDEPRLPAPPPEAKGEIRKYLSSKNFDLSPFRMGYFNSDGKAIFVARTPVRQNKQGLSQGVATFNDVRGRRSDDMTFNNMLKSQGFVDMVAGKYPSFKDAGNLLGDKEHSSVAISPSFAFWIDHDLESLLLMHKGIKCGIAMKNDKVLKVPPKFHFLRQEMEQYRIPLA